MRLQRRVSVWTHTQIVKSSNHWARKALLACTLHVHWREECSLFNAPAAGFPRNFFRVHKNLCFRRLLSDIVKSCFSFFLPKKIQFRFSRPVKEGEFPRKVFPSTDRNFPQIGEEKSIYHILKSDTPKNISPFVRNKYQFGMVSNSF